MIRATLLALAALALLPTAAAAQAPVCDRETIQQALIDAGKVSQQDFEEFGRAVALVRCGDITNDGVADALFTVYSGGTAGDTNFGVLRGGEPRTVVLYKQGYKIGIARRNRRSFAVIQPHYRTEDANCCPSSFRIRRYTWTGERFKAGKARKSKKAPRRFYD
jgi:hypothetical protein